jgi:hypothetical protein
MMGMKNLASNLAQGILTLTAALSTACGSSSGTQQVMTPPSMGGSNPTGVTPTPSPVDATCKTVLAGPYKDSLKAPQNVVATPDDYSAQIQWGGPLTASDDHDAEGYRVCWGPKGKPPIYGRLTTYRVTQLNGVQNGDEFDVYVQAVDGLGNASKPSDPVTFTGDPARVNALREKMTAFFDDFNTPHQPLDELRWNTAYSFCNDPVANGSFVVDLHAVNTIGNNSYLPGSKPGCDRDQNINRARQIFDFKDREGLITFDFDGADGDRSTWYVDVFPYEGKPSDLIDISGHVTFDPGPGHPGRFLRFSQSGNLYMINRYDEHGDPLEIFKAEVGVMYPEIQTVPAVMRHWELRVAKNHASITINGIKVLDAPNLGLDFEKGVVTWDQFAYNPAKIGRPFIALHFDNFGFDGPATSPRVHNYKVSLLGDDGVRIGEADPNGPDGTVNIPIPDDPSAAKSARLYYTLQNNGYRWDKSDSFSINGQTFPIPEPTSPTGITLGEALVDDYRAFAVVAEIPTSALVKGDNAVSLHAVQALFRNLHIEVEPSDSEFTQPFKALPGPAIPELPIIGPGMVVGRVNDRVNNLFSDTDSLRLNSTDVKGTITIALKIETLRPLLASGLNFGVTKAELLIDKKVVDTIMTNAASPAPQSSDLAFTVDTTKLSNGPHEVFGVAYDAANTKGRPRYPDNETNENGVDPNHYAPIIINVNN